MNFTESINDIMKELWSINLKNVPLNSGYGDIFAFLGGAFLKIIDEIIDLNLQINPIYLSTAKTIVILLLSYSKILSIGFIFFLFVTLVASNLSKRYDDVYWDSLTICCFIILMLRSNELIEMIYKISKPLVLLLYFGVCMYISVGCFMEDYYFPEEYSFYKMYFRLFMLSYITCYFVFAKSFSPEFTETFQLTGITQYVASYIGYLPVSIVAQYYLCNNISTSSVKPSEYKITINTQKDSKEEELDQNTPIESQSEGS